MIRIILLLSFLILFLQGFSQFNSVTGNGTPSPSNQTPLNWDDPATWSGSAPGFTSIAGNVFIDAYVERNGGITFSNTAGRELTIESGKTLVIKGNINFSTSKNFAKILAETNSTLIVDGSVVMGKNNAGVIAQAGSFIVITGSITDNGGGGNSIGVTGEANIYVDGASADLSAAPSDYADLEDDNPEVWNFLENNVPLPITLKEFVASPETSSTLLNWTTYTEENFEFFEIQRADVSGDFEVIATVKGNGWSKEEINYTWSDENPKLGLNYYRLESVDYDGYREVFPTIAIIFEPENRKLQITPNPVSFDKVLKLQNTFSEPFSLTILNLYGQAVFELEGVDNIFELPSNLQAGIYIARYKVNGLAKTQKLIVR